MKRLILAVAAASAAILPSETPQAEPATLVQPAVTLDIRYSEAADLFSLMDNVSNWWPGFTDPIYREDWEARFGWSDEDQAWANRYREYRRRTFSEPSQGQSVETSSNGLFASAISFAEKADPLADYLLQQDAIAPALENLNGVMSKADAEALRGFYAHFEPKWRTLIAESAPLAERATELRGQIDDAKLSQFIDTISRFYNAQAKGEFRVVFTRFPAQDRSSAEVAAGKVLVLKSPINLSIERAGWDTIIAHEFAHYISAQQSEDQKRRLSDRFLEICKVPQRATPYWMIEEPLAVAVGQVAYSEIVLGEPLDPRSNWYFIPWIDLTARTLAPSVMQAIRSGKTLEETTIVEEAAERCRDIKSLAEQLAPRPS